MNRSLEVVNGDLSDETYSEWEILGKEYGLAVDTETTGLDPRSARIEVISIAVPERSIVIAVNHDERPHSLLALLEDERVPKIFHNALFDVSFFKATWECIVRPIFCTKIAARLARVERNPTLQSLTGLLLNVEMDKSTRYSDWTQRPLTNDQVEYAAHDVLHLHDLHRLLSWHLADAGQSTLFEECMSFLNARAALQVEGFGDIYAYELPADSC